jgi:uncharacterized membrane protein YkoI
MKKRWIALIGCTALVTGATLSSMSFAKQNASEVKSGTIQIQKENEADFPTMARISPEQAVQQALNTVQGQVLKTELQNENGFLVYGVEVVTADKSIMEVKVDAGSGQVLAVDHDKADEGDEEEHED